MQQLSKARVQGIKVNVFDGHLIMGAIGLILTTTALGLTHTDPIGCLIGGAREAVALDEAFHQVNGMAVFALPILADAPCNPAQQMTG